MSYIDNYYRNKDLSWKGLSLYWYKQETGLKLIQDETHPHMYWIVRPPDFKSKNFYNLINARENARNLYLTHMNSDEDDINRIHVP